MDGTEEVRDRIARSKYIPEAEIARFEEIKAQIKADIENNSTWRDDTCLKSIVRLVKLLGPLMMVEQVEGANMMSWLKIHYKMVNYVMDKYSEVNEDKAMVQILKDQAALNIRDTKVRFRGKPLSLKRI